jgi:hypothetical protein
VFSQDASNRYFETVLLFKIVQRSYNKAFEVDINHQSLRARAFKVLMKGMIV